MSERNLMFKKNEFIYLSSGCYSDYSVTGWFKVLKDFDGSVILQEWKSNNPELESYDDQDAFTSYLTSHEFLEEVNHRELHLGDYGELNLKIWSED